MTQLNNMVTLLRVRGYITSAHILEPVQRFVDTQPKYTLTIQPENPHIYDDIQERVYTLRERQMMEQGMRYEPTDSYYLENRVVKGCEIHVESLYKPDLQGEFSDIERDEQLLGSFVQSVGHLYIHETGIVCLSSHIVEPAFHPNNDFDPIHSQLTTEA